MTTESPRCHPPRAPCLLQSCPLFPPSPEQQTQSAGPGSYLSVALANWGGGKASTGVLFIHECVLAVLGDRGQGWAVTWPWLLPRWHRRSASQPAQCIITPVCTAPAHCSLLLRHTRNAAQLACTRACFCCFGWFPISQKISFALSWKLMERMGSSTGITRGQWREKCVSSSIVLLCRKGWWKATGTGVSGALMFCYWDQCSL